MIISILRTFTVIEYYLYNHKLKENLPWGVVSNLLSNGVEFGGTSFEAVISCSLWMTLIPLLKTLYLGWKLSWKWADYECQKWREGWGRDEGCGWRIWWQQSGKTASTGCGLWMLICGTLICSINRSVKLLSFMCVNVIYEMWNLEIWGVCAVGVRLGCGY